MVSAQDPKISQMGPCSILLLLLLLPPVTGFGQIGPVVDVAHFHFDHLYHLNHHHLLTQVLVAATFVSWKLWSDRWLMAIRVKAITDQVHPVVMLQQMQRVY